MGKRKKSGERKRTTSWRKQGKVRGRLIRGGKIKQEVGMKEKGEEEKKEDKEEEQ